jgi:hypothetical protein
MARTTLDIDDALLRELKGQAAREGRTLQSVVNERLRQRSIPAGTPPFSLNLIGWHGDLRPGVDLCNRDALFDLMDGR